MRISHSIFFMLNKNFQPTYRLVNFYSLVFVFFCIAVSPTYTKAQVAISAGVQEVYDDNIFLENNKRVPLETLQTMTGTTLTEDSVPEQIDGETNDDFITNVHISASGAVPLTKYLKTAAEAKLGALFFADQTDENRLTLDALLTSTTEKELLPDPFFASVSALIKSGSNSVAVAQGTAAQQSQLLISNLSLGMKEWEFAPKTGLGATYTLGYYDYLGQFTFNDNATEDLGLLQKSYEDEGSDYLTNSLDTVITHHLTSKANVGLYAGVTDYVFTSVGNPELQEQTTSDLDRIEGRGGARASYTVNQELSFNGSAGILGSYLKNDPEDDSERDQQGFVFTAGADYTPDPGFAINLGVDQSQNTDISGNRIVSRSANLNLSKAVGDRLKFTSAGRYLQFDVGDTLSDATERYEFTLAMQYSVTQAVSIGAGWNYTNQNADESNHQQDVLFGNGDYESNRFFITLNAGLVGTKG